MSKYVLTGGPGVGKTTLLAALGASGYPLVPEAATQVIAEEQQQLRSVLPWTDFLGFQCRVYLRQFALETSVAGDVIFCDRSFVDAFAYCSEQGVALPAALHPPWRYDGVFLLAPLPTYEQTAVRVEDSVRALRLHDLIGRAYAACGYTPVVVPVCSVAERVDFLLSHLPGGDLHGRML